MKLDIDFYKKRKVLITGHTGFKGSWMCKLLVEAGADVIGYALEPPTEPSLFKICGLASQINSVTGDIRDLPHLRKVFEDTQPEIVIHMAAQPIVRDSYKDPVYTYDVRLSDSVKSFINVTTDKVYRNKEWVWGYREDEELNGFDPYSNSKSCSELVTSSYKRSFFDGKDVAISTARAGNVIGGVDFANDRIIPDCIRAASKGKEIIVRNPFSTRPYEHVLEPVAAYLMIAKEQYEDKEKYEGNYNVGPEETDCWTTGNLVTLFCEKWNSATGEHITWKNEYDGGPHEANFLKLDCSKIKSVLGWSPRWNVETAMEKIVEWSLIYLENGDVAECMRQQIKEFLETDT